MRKTSSAIFLTPMLGASFLSSISIADPARASAKNEDAIYWISAETSNGLGGDIAAMFRGGGSGPAHDLVLQLAAAGGSPTSSSGEHFAPPALRVGASLPLRPPAGQASLERGDTPSKYGSASDVSARMEIYWGCGNTAQSGSPRLLDMRNPGAAFTGVSPRSMIPPSAKSHSGYAEWPNPKSRAQIKSGSSLVGSHLVRSNFAPEITFDLSAQQDFLAPLTVTQRPEREGALGLAWPSVGRATGYFLSVMGSTKDGTAIIWTSSQVPLAQPMLDEYLAPAEVARLIEQKAVLPASTHGCTIPAAVMNAIEVPILTITAFGEETNLAEPKPSTASAGWRPSWQVKVRYRSKAQVILGETGAAMSGLNTGLQDDPEYPEASPKPRKKGGLLRAIGKGLLPGG